MTDSCLHLHSTTDAEVWAEEFCRLWPAALCQIEGSEGVEDGDEWKATMIGWFANAIMAGVDSVNGGPVVLQDGSAFFVGTVETDSQGSG